MIWATASLVVLEFTTPDSGQFWQGDTIADCRGGGPVSVDSILVMVQPVTGGPHFLHHVHPAALPGSPDTVQLDPGPGCHVYVLAKNQYGVSCASNSVYVPGTVTSVPTGGIDQLISSNVFDIRGRLVRGPPASGIYFRRDTYRSGRIVVRKVALLR